MYPSASPKALILRGYSNYLFVIPLLFISLYIYLMHVQGPFYLTRIDPDYVYLLNGSNASTLHFNRIGHVHHPGTPFQVFLGFCIALVHFLFGKDSTYVDVLARPEYYLSWCSGIMAGLLFILLIWGGKIGEKIAGKPGAFLLQITPFLSPILVDLSLRVMPDRFGMILSYLLLLLLLNYDRKQTEGARVRSMLLGILSGIIVAIKINFFPILALPFLLLKEKRIFVFYSILGFFIGILPVLNRVSDFSKFTTKVIRHDGIYGSGAEQMINMDLFLQHAKLIGSQNILLLLLSVVCLFLIINRRMRKTEKSSISQLFYVAFIVATSLSIFIVAKHYKNYYLAPILIAMGPTLLVIYKDLLHQRARLIILILSCLFAGHSIFKVTKAKTEKASIIAERKELEPIASEFSGGSYIMIKPEWKWGLSQEYGLIFGLSYFRHRHRLAPEIKQLYPKVLSYEGEGKPFRNMRVVEVSDSVLLKNGYPIVVVDQEGRRAKEVIVEIGHRLGYEKIDSLYLSPEMTLFKLDKSLQK